MEIKTEKEWRDQLTHFFNCINFGASCLDADAIQFMNEWFDIKKIKELKE